MAAVSVVLGLQWGDEGKGKLVDILAQDMDIVARCAGGNNAGHTVQIGDAKYDFHLLPSGIVSPSCVSVIGHGVVVHLTGLFDEIRKNEDKGLKGWETRLLVSDRAHIVLDVHQQLDGIQEEQRASAKIGTTRKGIGPCYTAKAARSGMRVCDLVYHFPRFEQRFRDFVADAQKRFPTLQVDVEAQLAMYIALAERLRPLVTDTITYVNDAIDSGKRVLVEGANATMLDLDFGTYPYVTSSSCTVGGACTGLGIPPQRIQHVYGVLKAYSTRVGDGGYPTEMVDDSGKETDLCVLLRKIGHEYGVTTGRPRRCGWFDVVAALYAVRINGATALCLTKLDCLDTFDEIKVGVGYTVEGKPIASVPASIEDLNRVKVVYETLPGWKTDITAVRRYEDLPEKAKAYIQYIEAKLRVPIRWVGVGPARDATIEVK